MKNKVWKQSLSVVLLTMLMFGSFSSDLWLVSSSLEADEEYDAITPAQEIPREDVVIGSSAWGPPPGWSPLLPSQCWAYQLMYPKLYLYSPYTDEWIPYAAESYEWIDKYTVQVKIRDEAEWWDGEPVTAEDCKYSLELGKKYVVSMYTPLWDCIESVEAIDEKTVQITTSDEKLNYFEMFGVLNGPLILPKHIWEGLEDEYGDKLPSEFRNDEPDKIVGAGPYRLMSWTEEVYYYERVDDWWGKDTFGIPNPKYIAHPDVKNNTAAALAFEAGEIDVMTHFIPKIWEMWEVKGLARRTYYDHPPYYVSGGVTFVWINFDRMPLDDATVRRAIAHAIPFDDMISKAYYNYSIRAAPVPIIHTSPAAVLINGTLIEQYGWEYNITEAKQILDDAGIIDTDGDGIREMPDGTKLGPFVIQVPYGWTDWMMMCDMIATNLGEIGIECTTEFPDFSVWWSRLSEKDWDFVLGWADANPGYNHPWNAFGSTMDNRLSHPAGNWENYDNPDVPPLIDAIPKESDAEKLKSIYNQLQEIWLTDIPGIPLFYGATWYEYSSEYWDGWPNEENGFWFANFYGEVQGILPAVFSIVPKGETPSQPSWVVDTKFSTDKMFEQIPTFIYVPDDYLTIQWAVDNASAGHTIIVRDGIYTENVNAYKPLTIRSENGPANCTVQAYASAHAVFEVTASNVTISGFTIQNGAYGIHLSSDNNVIAHNTLSKNSQGIALISSSNNNLIYNTASNNSFYGIWLDSSSNNMIYLNNLINNTNSCYSENSTNIWNSTSLMTYVYNGSVYRNYMGNHWSEYVGDDADGDGIGDTPYSIDSDRDYYPLMERFEKYRQSREDVVYISVAWGPPSGWNPLLWDPAWGNNLQYESLFIYSTRDDVWIPWLAESYAWVDEYALLVRIRDEAEWWDGRPLTAQDVRYTFDLGKKYVVAWSGVWDYLEDVVVVDEKTVLFVTSEAKLNYFQFLSLLYDVIVMPKHRWEKLEEELGENVTRFRDDDPEKIVGSGCYRLDQWSEDVWYYRKVEDWWGKDIFGMPRPNYIAHPDMKDNMAAALAFEAGELDAMGHFIPEIWELWEVKGLPVRTYHKHRPYYIGSSVVFLYANYAKYPLNLLEVRRAVSYAIPYDDLISKAYYNYSVRASPSMIIHTIPAYAKWINDTLVAKYGYELNLTKAAQILDDVGIIDRDGDGIRETPNGTVLRYTISVPYGWTDWMMMSDMIAANLGDIGIDAITEFPDFSVWYDRLCRGHFDLMISWDAGMGFDHPWNTFRFVMDPRLTGPVGEFYSAGNWERYMNEEVIPLIDAAAKEMDEAKLAEIYSDLQELGLTDLPAIPLFYGAAWYEYSTAYWLGWPCEEDPRWLSPWPWDLPNNIPVYFGLSKASEGSKPMPSWVTDLQIPTAKIFEDYLKPPSDVVITSFHVRPGSFSPNGDRRKDTATIRALFTAQPDVQPIQTTIVDWVLTVKTAVTDTVRAWAGKGGTVNVRWDGRDDVGNVVPDGEYHIILQGRDKDGKVIEMQSRPVIIDTVQPTITEVSDLPDPFDPSIGETTTIGYTLSERCYVMIGIYDSAGRTVGVIRATQPVGANAMKWDGKIQRLIAPDGTYTYEIHATDMAGNNATPAKGTTTVKS